MRVYDTLNLDIEAEAARLPYPRAASLRLIKTELAAWAVLDAACAAEGTLMPRALDSASPQPPAGMSAARARADWFDTVAFYAGRRANAFCGAALGCAPVPGMAAAEQPPAGLTPEQAQERADLFQLAADAAREAAAQWRACAALS